jgi:hypothetical protein
MKSGISVGFNPVVLRRMIDYQPAGIKFFIRLLKNNFIDKKGGK